MTFNILNNQPLTRLSVLALVTMLALATMPSTALASETGCVLDAQKVQAYRACVAAEAIKDGYPVTWKDGVPFIDKTSRDG